MPKSYGELVRSYREAAGLTQEELAALAGLGVRTISDIERGRTARPHPKSAERLSRALGRDDLARVRAVAELPIAAGVAGAPVSLDQRLEMRGLPPQVRFSLPADTDAFTGRSEELDQIVAAAKNAAGTGVVAVGAINGMPGAGKTTLAVHAAHALAEEFPDRQLFIDLHAHTPGREPVQAEDALAGLLAAVGLDPRYVPGDLEGRAALWRDRMAGQRALLVFDNVADSGQVAPLLPGAGGCLVLVTSRRHLSDLPGAVTSVLVDALPEQEAAEMFTRLASGAAAERADVAEVVRLAGCLPLAISLLARVLARHPSWAVADVAAEAQAGVLTLVAEKASVAVMFEMSYRHLDPDSRRLFRLLGAHPGVTIDEYAAAALAGTSPREVAVLLDGLHREGLLTEAGHRWYGMHDLIRRYARDLADGDAAGVQRALDRLLDYYQCAADLAGRHLARQTRPSQGRRVRAGFEVPVIENADQALAWARSNLASLLACLDLVTHARDHARVVALTAGLAALLRRDGRWAQAITRHTVAVQAARHLADGLAEANALTDLGQVRQLTGDQPGNAQVLEQALVIYRDLGDRLGEANTLHNLGIARRMIDDYPGAGQFLEQALMIYRDIGDRLGEAITLHDLGRLTDDYPAAVRFLEQALRICGDLGDRLGEANVLGTLGSVRRLTGDFAGAAEVMEEAVAIYRDLGSRFGEASALRNLGSVREMTGDYSGAAQVLEEALGIYRDLGNRIGEANALHNLGWMREMTGDYAGAAQLQEEALDIYRDLGSRLGEANALRNLGTVLRLAGDDRGAARVLPEALCIYRDIGARPGETEALNELGILHRADGDLAAAQRCHQQALDLARAIGSAREEACALAGLGRSHRAAGASAEAESLLRQAHRIFRRIGAAEARAVLAELETLTRS